MTVLNADIGTVERAKRTDSWRADFIRRSGFRCHYCNRSGGTDLGPDDRPWHVDHKHPISRGGPDEDDNLALACKRCNLTKGAQPYDLFREFARLAFWVPDDWRASEGVLDSLMDGYARWGDEFERNGGWKVDLREKAISIIDPDQSLEPLLKLAGSYHCERSAYVNVLYLVAEMYEALPAMIAEIRMHRAAERGDAA